MTLDPKLDLIGIGKQSAKGTIASSIGFGHGLKSGGLSVDPQQSSDALTAAGIAPAGAYRDQVNAGADFMTRPFQKSIGAYLLAALGSISTTGVGDPYAHVITMGSTLNYWSLWNQKGDGTIIATKDNKLDELRLEWSGNAPVDLSARFVGGVMSVPGAFSPTVDESDSVDYYIPAGGTFKYDLDSSTPATADVLGGSVTVSRGAEARYRSGSIEAFDVLEGPCDVTVSLTVEPDDMTMWRTLATGTSSGTAMATAPVYGSFEIKFMAGTHYLMLSATKVGFLVGIPPADPEGKAAQVELSGICYRNTTTPLTATVSNAQASY